jgi:hypothetical protein
MGSGSGRCVGLSDVLGAPTPRSNNTVAAVKCGSPSLPLKERIRPLQERIAAYPSTGLEADKAFFDALSGNI